MSLSSFLYTQKGWKNSGGGDGMAAEKYNNDTGIWTDIASVNAQDTITTLFSNCNRGGWDGSRWYVISVTGGLHAYSPGSNTWTGPLVSGSTIISGLTPQNSHWSMCSDGSYIYILASRNDFRRYDPSSDSLTTLSIPGGSSYAATMFLCYDGSGSIYGSKGGGNPANISKYDIGRNTWTQIASGDWSSQMGAGSASWAVVLKGDLWMIQVNNNVVILRAYQYVTSGNYWITKATQSNNDYYRPVSPGGEDTDTTIRIWPNNSGVASSVYDIVQDTWSAGAASPNTFTQGNNSVVSRVFSAAFTWYQSDGTTAIPITVDLGSGVQGQTLTYHAKVTTPVSRSNGVTISVPTNTASDAPDAVTICATVGGSYSTSFATGALNAGDQFDVFIKVTPTAAQALGLLKRFSLEIISN
jgi:hypothetical protein